MRIIEKIIRGRIIKKDIDRATAKPTEKNAIENSPLNGNCLGCVIVYRATIEPKKEKK